MCLYYVRTFNFIWVRNRNISEKMLKLKIFNQKPVKFCGHTSSDHVAKNLNFEKTSNIDTLEKNNAWLTDFEPLEIVEEIYEGNFNMQRVCKVTENVYRSGRPLNEAAIIDFKNLGIHRIVCLINSNNKHYDDIISTEKMLANKHGIKIVHIPVDEKIGITQEAIDKIYKLYEEKDKHPFIFHCNAGQDRAGIVNAFIDVDHLGMSFDQAYNRMLSQNHDFGDFPNLDKDLYEHCIKKGEDTSKMHPKEILEYWIDKNRWHRNDSPEEKNDIINLVMQTMLS